MPRPIGARCRKRLWRCGLAVIVPLLWLCGAATYAAVPPPRIDAPGAGDRPAGERLAAELRALRPPGNSLWSGLMKVTKRGKLVASLPVVCRTVVDGDNWRVIYSTPGSAELPAQELTIVRQAGSPNAYFLARAEKPGAPLPTASPIKPEEIWVEFAGTDFTLADLGLDFLHWPQQRLLNPGRNEMRRTRPCDVLESANSQAPGKGYSKVLAWFDSEHKGLITAEAYGSDGKRIKEFNLGRIAKIDGSYQLQEMEMLGVRSGSRTKIEFDVGPK